MSLNETLAQLEQARLLQQVPEPELAYIFRHTLVQETAYETLLFKSRREIHHQVALCYEQIYANNLEAHAALLAHHFARAGDRPEQTLRYAVMAGDAAFEHNANAEAVGHYAAALDLVVGGTLPLSPAESSGHLVHLYSRRGRALELSGRYEQAVANYGEMAGLARVRNDPALELAALMAEATARTPPTAVQDFELAQELSDRALALASELGDTAAAARILWNLSLLNSFKGEPRNVILYGEQAIALARELGLREQLAYALNDIPRGYSAVGDSERAEAALAEAQALWRELGNQPMLADNLNSAAEFYFGIGELDRALHLAQQAHRLSEVIGNRWGIAYSAMAQGGVLAVQGQAAEAIDCLQQSIRQAELVGFVHPLAVGRLMLSLVFYDLGALPRARQVLDEAIGVAQSQLLPAMPLLLGVLARQQLASGDWVTAHDTARESQRGAELDERTLLLLSFGAAMIWLPQAEILLADGEGQVALDLIDWLLAGMDRARMRPYRADVLLLRAQALLALDRHEEAWMALQAARQEAEAQSARPILWRILAASADLAMERADQQAAQRLRSEAQAVVAFIADHTGSEDLRATFLGQPVVHAVLAGVNPAPGEPLQQNST